MIIRVSDVAQSGDVTRYPSGELGVPPLALEEIPCATAVRVFFDVPSSDGIFLGGVILNQLRKLCFSDVSVIVGLSPGSRGTWEEVSAYSRMVIAAAWLHPIILVDPHNDNVRRSYESICRGPAAIVSAVDIIRGNGWSRDFSLVVAPDKGAFHRARQVAEHFGVPYVVGSKVRRASGEITDYTLSIDDLDPSMLRNILVVDDICDGGATFAAVRNCLPEESKVTLYVTHGLFTGDVVKNLSGYDEVVTSESLPVPNEVRRQMVSKMGDPLAIPYLDRLEGRSDQ